MDKIRVHYVSGPIGNPINKEVWGGTAATNYIIKKALDNSEKYKLVIKPRTEFFSMEEVNLFLEAGNVSWMDDSGMLQKYYEKGYKRPDVLGPIDRSPVKRYNNGEWESIYTPEYFYNGFVLRLNEAEEKELTLKEKYKGRGKEFISKVSFIRHGIDLDLLKPNYTYEKKYVLWVGNKSRDAKNYPLFEEIMKKVNEMGGLPEGYKFLVLNNYNISDYFEVLNETALLVNTSKYESFCNAVGEAMAKGVPSLVRKKFNGEYMFLDRPLQIDYNVDSYVKTILEILNNPLELERQRMIARTYAEENFSLDTMRKDIESVFDKVLEDKK